MAKTNFEKTRNFSGVTYLPTELLKQFFASKSCIKHYAYITHDRDIIKETGEIKTIHTHFVIETNNPLTTKTVSAWFDSIDYVDDKGMNCSTLVQAARDKSSCFRYLTHKDDSNKVQYPDDEVTTDSLSYYQSACAGEADNQALSIINDILENRSLRYLVATYGRDFVYHYNDYRLMAAMIKQETSVFEDLDELQAYIDKNK